MLYLGYNLMLFYLFCCSNCGISGHWKLIQLASVSLCYIPIIVKFCFVFIFLNTSLYSGAIKYSMLFLYILCPSHRISHFSMEPLFLLLESRVRNQNLVVRSAHYYQGINVSKTSQLTEQINICVYIIPHI